MTAKELFSPFPEKWERGDMEVAIPKTMTSLGEVTIKAGDSAVFGPIGLTTIKYILLHVLSLHRKNPTMTELRKHLLRSPANLTQLVDSLEEAGWIRRTPSPEDRRATQIELTESGHAKIEEAEAELSRRMKIFFEKYSDEDLRTFLNLLSRFGNDMLSLLNLGDFISYPEC